ncbi:FHA domain-containing protein [Nocardia sp. NPDC051756]|uniref:FHA domain-containing protein n=1 Tax=Nocardia sp. NPDC051756 TaxID=3154751 RepID=UPI00342DFB1A
MEQLIVLYPAKLAGTALRLGPGRQLLGRSSRTDLRLDDQHVSAVHAAINNLGGQVTVEDLGSVNGTRIGGEPFTGATLLRDGDIVTFGNIEARFEQTSGPPTTMLSPEDSRRPPPSRVGFDVDRQTARQINNVGRDQHNNSYVQQRESFLREAAASRTKARFVFWIGLFLTTGGMLGYAYYFVRAAGEFNTVFKTAAEPGVIPEPPAFSFFGPDTSLGIPAGLICFMIAFIGSILLFIGLILWIVTAARTRNIDTDPRYAWNSPYVR